VRHAEAILPDLSSAVPKHIEASHLQLSIAASIPHKLLDSRVVEVRPVTLVDAAPESKQVLRLCFCTPTPYLMCRQLGARPAGE
jgi:hypothetical protein